MRGIGLLIFFTTLLLCRAAGQQPYALNLQQLTDLPTKHVYCIYQDHKGFIWLATEEGLFSYDGFTYTNYKAEIQTTVVGSNIQEDKYGRIWYQNFDGFLYYVDGDKLRFLPQNPPPDFITFGLTDTHLFVVQKKGVDSYDLRSLHLTKTIAIPIERAEHATVLNQEFYLISDNTMFRIDEQLQLSSSHFFADKKLHVKYIYPYKNTLYVASKRNETKQLYFFDNRLNYIKSVPIPGPVHIQGSDVVDNKIWLHTPQGVFVVDTNDEKKTEVVLFPENSSSKVIKDYQDNYWFASLNNGVQIVPNLVDHMYHVQPFLPSTFSLTSKGFLMGTEKGELIEADQQFNHRKLIYSNKEQLPIYYLYHDQKDPNIIISDNGFSIINRHNRTTKHFDIAVKELVPLDKKYYAIAASGFFGLLLNPNAHDDMPSIWDRLFYLHRDPRSPSIAALKKGIRAKSVCYQAEQQRVFFATNIGTFAIQPQDEKEIMHMGEPFYAKSIVKLDNLILLLDSKGNLHQLKSDHKIENLNGRLKIPAGTISKIKSTGKELLILGSTCIFAFNGLDVEQFKLPLNSSHIRDFWIGDQTLTLLTDSHLLKISNQPKPPKKQAIFRIERFFANGIPKDWKTPLTLRHQENTVTITFSILEFINKNVEVYYRINGKEWILINTQARSLAFPSLAAGSYLLEFKIHDQLAEQQIRFEVKLPFWKKWWFYLSVCLLAAGIVFLYFRRQSNLMKQQIKLLNEKVTLEKKLGKSMLASIKSQMNPHFFYNALNTIQAYIFTNDKQRANNYLSKFSKLTRIILEMSEKETVSLQEEIVAIQLYLELEKMRFSTNFSYEILLENDMDTPAIEFPPMLLQPYIENALKHGLLHKKGDKTLLISFRKKDDLMYVSIADNGIGRQRSKALNALKNKSHKSFATEANMKRLEILNKERARKITVTITDNYDTAAEYNCGTKVELVIPI